jgi:hypothetical protein
MKKIIYSLIFLSLISLPSLAKASFVASTSDNNVKIEGDCKENIKIEMADANDQKNIAYTSGVVCKDGKFIFSDNLVKWNMIEGKYAIFVDGKKIGKTVVLDKGVTDVQSEQLQNENVKNSNELAKSEAASNTVVGEIGAENNFLQAFLNLQKSILDMRNTVSDTQYPGAIKTGITIVLDSMDSLVKKVTEYLWLAENTETKPEIKSAESLGEIKTLNTTAIIVPTEEADSGLVKSDIQEEKTVEQVNTSDISNVDTEKVAE